MIYMDNAATTMRKPKEVAEAVMHAMNSMGNAGRGANEASLSAARVIYDTRELLADFFDAENPKQIVFTSNSTESIRRIMRSRQCWNIIPSCVRCMRWKSVESN